MKIIVHILGIVAFVLQLSGVASAQELQELEGAWQVEGWDLAHERNAEEPYTGTATLTVHGDSLRYEGEMDDLTYSGIGIWHVDSSTLALQFTETETQEVGVAHFIYSDGELSGNWAFGTDGDHGFEIWTRQ